MDIIEKNREEYRAWCEKLDILSVSDLNRVADSPELKTLINICEIRHEQKLSEIAYNIKKNSRKVVFIAGPSSSGKTTTATRLQLHLKALGLNAVPISLDDYYLDRTLMPINEDNKPDFEALESIDYRLFNKNIADLTDGLETSLPAFDFTKAISVKDARRLKLHSDDVIIIEGIHGLNPLIADNVPDNVKFRVYCTPLSVLKDDNGNRIPSHTIRMIRRLIRDYYFRNSDFRVTFSLWPNQETSAEKNIFPYTDTADIIFNTSLLYELCVYKSHLLDVLSAAQDDDENIDEIQYLRNLAKSITSITREFIPGMSLIGEFIKK